MKVLITGGSGQLGREFRDVLVKTKHKVYSFSRSELDVTNFTQVKDTLVRIEPDVVIHSGAYTKVDLAEDFHDEAYLANAIGTRNIAVVSQEIQANLVYISTDYVFDGEKEGKYNEFDIPNPQNIYGKSKLAGEYFVRDFHSKFFIVRTSWLYGKQGNNFVKTMLRLAEKGEVIKVVNDQKGSPTYTLDVAEKVTELIQTRLYGVYHITNSGECTWFEFASKIFELVNKKVDILPVDSNNFPQKAKRPRSSVLDHLGLRLNGFSDMRSWENALESFLKKDT